MNKLVLISILTILLAGCQSIPDVVTLPETKTVKIDPKLLVSCQKTLPELQIGEYNPQPELPLLTHASKIAKVYADCYNRQEASIKQLKEFANIKE